MDNELRLLRKELANVSDEFSHRVRYLEQRIDALASEQAALKHAKEKESFNAFKPPVDTVLNAPKQTPAIKPALNASAAAAIKDSAAINNSAPTNASTHASPVAPSNPPSKPACNKTTTADTTTSTRRVVAKEVGKQSASAAAAPLLGQDTQVILSGILGYEQSEIDRLHESGAIG